MAQNNKYVNAFLSHNGPAIKRKLGSGTRRVREEFPKMFVFGGRSSAVCFEFSRR